MRIVFQRLLPKVQGFRNYFSRILNWKTHKEKLTSIRSVFWKVHRRLLRSISEWQSTSLFQTSTLLLTFFHVIFFWKLFLWCDCQDNLSSTVSCGRSPNRLVVKAHLQDVTIDQPVFIFLWSICGSPRITGWMWTRKTCHLRTKHMKGKVKIAQFQGVNRQLRPRIC